MDLATSTEKLAEEIKALSDLEKLQLVDKLLADLDKPDSELDKIWADRYQP
jgi:hypothetical protein